MSIRSQLALLAFAAVCLPLAAVVGFGFVMLGVHDTKPAASTTEPITYPASGLAGSVAAHDLPSIFAGITIHGR